ncbi:MAG: hypothetical protein XD49_0105 [Caldanaerobacter subterraneus]|jgi:uncharacterized alkaline shock family protein YloU|uniref:Asp23/Gls24 family envelope stress response protein n=3 Tax=Caldanaerobacter subterraneus TaxID=911092 RepID=Q8R9U2_CALS4|nr:MULTISPECIES: Asp23/Gls24 family envelope stress response protein [Caldanaerobacter]AAM24712.1 conserved hypothetical protein [Caldanaerobacter subterraneus subsp. tengcongensis MB4]ERM92397.1 hypothetical protein O163_05165 [Caldanaerobacter subterraneus subsp. yonseiensis KB-1]KUK09931.1 MAG: hypothetical protein XD49_0105 [Caldanaerobacter subterraneus]MBE3579183.1 Asp23/Gls24 family envelope stress response protein [Caldanaerobacter subterraneus]MCS3915724.1 putative alkaline shock fami
MVQIKNNYGSITISNDAIAAVTSRAVSECYGIVGLGRKGANGLVEIFKTENSGKGVKVSSSEEGLILEVYIVVLYGVNIRTVSLNAIERVKYAVEKFTGLKVSNVTINVQGIKVDN